MPEAGVPADGERPRSGPSRYIAKSVSPPGAVAEAWEARQTRYGRRQVSRDWLIRAAREAGAKPGDVEYSEERAPRLCPECEQLQAETVKCREEWRRAGRSGHDAWGPRSQSISGQVRETRAPTCPACHERHHQRLECATCTEIRHGSGWVRPPRPARCSWRAAEEVAVHAGPAGDQELAVSAWWGGVERCASVWACPQCSAAIRNERARDVQAAVVEHAKNGGGLLFLTLTIRHDEAARLRDSLGLVIEAWRATQQGKAWVERRESLGLLGQIKATEITYGQNGWHPHLHVLLFTEKRSSVETVEKWREWLTTRWIATVQRVAEKAGVEGNFEPTVLRGIDLRIADGGGKVVGQYLAKVQEKQIGRRTDVALELTRFDLKRGRAGSLSPFELLDVGQGSSSHDEREKARCLWLEYYQATAGRRAIVWSRGLRDRFGLGAEADDETVVQESEPDKPETAVIAVQGATYDRMSRSPVRRAAVLEAVEAADLDAAYRIIGQFGDVRPHDARLDAATDLDRHWKRACAVIRQGWWRANRRRALEGLPGLPAPMLPSRPEAVSIVAESWARGVEAGRLWERWISGDATTGVSAQDRRRHARQQEGRGRLQVALAQR